MKKLLLFFARKIAFPMVVILAVPMTATAQKTDMKPLPVSLRDFKGFHPQRVTRASDKQGITATLKYEQIADMSTPRIAHQVFSSGDGFIVVGGRTTGFQLTSTAELYQNGNWQNLSIPNAHDGAFSVKLTDGRFMVGGGFSSAEGVGQTLATDIYDPQTRTFSTGPQLTTARAQSMAINVGGKIYVSGNWYAADPTMDYYDGTSFKAIGETDDRSNPYMFANREGDLLILSAYNTKGQSFGFYTFDDGTQMLLADMYVSNTGKTNFFGLPFTPQAVPLQLSDDTRPEDYHITQGGDNFYLILAKTTDGYQLYMLNMDMMQLYQFSMFNIPTIDTDGQAITWRGGVIVNEARQEIYIIGTSGPVSNQTLHVISLNYMNDEWTIASAKGFKHNLLTASWTLLSNGKLACSGGGIKDNTDAQRTAYIITPPVAGSGDLEPDDGDLIDRKFLVVETKDHVQTTYMLADKTQVLFAGSNLRVVSAKVDVTYNLSDILRFTYQTRSITGISELHTEQATIDYKDEQLVISGIQAGAMINIYSLDGKLVKQHTANHTGTYRLSLASLPKGIYIVKADNVTYKIMKR